MKHIVTNHNVITMQWRIQKIFEGSSFDGDATPAAKAALPRGGLEI